jgi:hypothetical protein
MANHNYQIFNVIVINYSMCRNVFMASIGQMKGQYFNATKMFF